MSSVPYPKPLLTVATALAEQTDPGKASELLHLALQAGRSVAWDWNVKSGEDSWFGDLQTIFGIASTTFVGRVEDFRRRVHPQDRELVWRAVQDAMQNRSLYVAEFRVIRVDGSVGWLAAQGRFYYSSTGEPVRMLGIGVDITDRKASEEALRRSEQALRENEQRLRLAAQAGSMYAFERRRAEEALSALSRRLIEAQEAERARIARNLHDDVGQRFAVILAALDQLKQGGSSADSGASRFEELRRQITDVSQSISNLSHELHSSSLRHLGMAKAMRGFCLELSEQQQVEITFSAENIPDSVTPETALCLFRILQEALHNAVKHSQTRQFAVDVRGAPNAILLTVRDSGAGFDPEKAMNGRGLGLISMQERLKLVNGELTIESRPAGGTAIRARAPVCSG